MGNVAHTSLSCPDALRVSFAELDPTKLLGLLLLLVQVFETLLDFAIFEDFSKTGSWTFPVFFRDSTSLFWVVHFWEFDQYSLELMFLQMIEAFCLYLNLN